MAPFTNMDQLKSQVEQVIISIIKYGIKLKYPLISSHKLLGMW